MFPLGISPAQNVPSQHDRPSSSPATAPLTPHPKPTLLKLDGTPLPSFNDWQCCVLDDVGRFMYIFGGCEPGAHAPTSHFFRLDLHKDPMTWVELTHKTRRAAQFSRLEPIPARTGATAAFYRRANRPYLLIYGGWNTAGIPTADFITVDLTNDYDPTWEVQQAVSDGTPRVDSALVVIADRVYVFGGHSQVRGRSGSESSESTQRSFCVLEFNVTLCQWQWTRTHGTRDLPAPFLGYGLSAAPWRGGILVVRGREVEDDIDLDEKSFHHYDPQWDRWSLLSVTGDLPPSAAWYNLRTGSASASGALLCVWYETERDDEASGQPLIACDVWAYQMGVTDELMCLRLATPIWRKKSADFDLFQLLPNGRMLMFGARSKRRMPRWDVCLDLTEAATAQWNARLCAVQPRGS